MPAEPKQHSILGPIWECCMGKTGLERLNEPDSNCNYNRSSGCSFCIDVLFCLGVEIDGDRNQAYVWRVKGTGAKYRSEE